MVVVSAETPGATIRTAPGRVRRYWIVNHVDEVIEVYRDRDAGAWRTLTVHGRGERVTMLRFPDVEVAVSDVLPPRPA